MRRVVLVVTPWLVILLLLGWSYFERRRLATPASHWLEVRSVIVAPSVEGVPPHVEVDRIIHRPVYGEWIVTIRAVTELGLQTHCVAQGKAHYSPGAIPGKDLDWWMDSARQPVRCALGAGQYVGDFAWTLYPDGYPPKPILRRSNVFVVSR